MRRKKIVIFSIILIILISGYLSIQGLDNNYFWDDEAATAIFARNLIRFGELTGWDGRNLFSFRGGLILDQNFINKFDSPLQFVVTALSFEIIGESTFSARIIFVLFGIFSLVLFYLIVSLEFKNQGDLKLFAILLFAFSPSFLLFIRQCHYYSLVLFFSLFTYYQYKKYLSTKNILYLGLTVIGFIGLFLSHYLISLAFGIAIIGLHLKYYLKQRPIYPYLIAGSVIISLIAIYINVYQVIIPESHREFNIEWLTNKGILLVGYFRDINAYTWFPWVMFICFLWLAFGKIINPVLKRKLREFGIFSLIYIIMVVLLYPVPVRTYGLVDIRYILPLLPFFCILSGVILSYLKNKSYLVAIIVIGLLLFTNIFSLNFWFPRKMRFDLLNYLYEIHNKYATTYESTTNFIQDNCNKDDKVVVIPPNMSIPLQFYAGDKIILAGRLDYDSKFPISKIRNLNSAFFVEEAIPDWIISFRMRPITSTILKYYFSKGMTFDLDEVLNVYYLGELARPEIFLHGYRPVTKFNPELDGILIYKRR